MPLSSKSCTQFDGKNPIWKRCPYYFEFPALNSFPMRRYLVLKWTESESKFLDWVSYLLPRREERRYLIRDVGKLRGSKFLWNIRPLP